MARTLSTVAKRAIYSSESGEVFVVLLTIDHPDFLLPIRVGSDAVQVTSDGNVHLPYPFRVSMPSELEDRLPEVTLEIDNVDRQIVDAVRSVGGSPMTVTMKVVLASSPNVIEAGPIEFTLRDVSYDASVVQGSLGFDDPLNEPFPGDSFTPARFSGLFT